MEAAYQMIVEGGRAEFVVACRTHSLPSVSTVDRSSPVMRPDIQLIELEDIGMAVGGANDLALGRGGLRGLVILVALTVG